MGLDKIFMFRMNQSEMDMLDTLAKVTYRTRAGVMRYLLHLVHNNPSLMSSISITKENKPETRSMEIEND